MDTGEHRQEAARSIATATDLYRKLERTIDRRVAYGKQQVDWLFDLAVTAWHLTDWLAAERGVDLKALRESACAKCPALAVCEQICNGAKHCKLDNPKLLPFDVARDVETTDGYRALAMNVRPGDRVDLDLTPALLVVDKDGKQWDGTEIAWRVASFWQKELRIESEE